MPVFVDNMRAKFGRMIMCHMFADTDDELHAMAEKLGIARHWHQRPPPPRSGMSAGVVVPGMKASWSHYDICLSKRALAVEYGAIEIEWRALPAWLKERGR